MGGLITEGAYNRDSTVLALYEYLLIKWTHLGSQNQKETLGIYKIIDFTVYQVT